MKRSILLFLLVSAVTAVVAGASVATAGPKPVPFSFTGRLLADPASDATSLSVKVKTGNRLALKKLVGQSQNQTFAVDADTEYLKWMNGVPTVVSIDALSEGDLVTVRIRAPRNDSLSEIEATPAGIVADRGQNPGRPHKALWLFRGTLNGPVSGSSLSLHVLDGNHRALRAMLGQPVDETFAVDAGTVFLLWQGKVPSVISASQLQAGDRVTVRVRAPRGSSLAQVEATPATRVAEHEPAPPEG